MVPNKKEEIHMYTFFHESGASIQVTSLDGEGWILAPDILRFFDYDHPLRELEEVDEDDMRVIQGVPFINKYAFKQFAYQAQPKMEKTDSGPHYYFREEGRLFEFYSWVSRVAINAMRGMAALPEDDDEWSFRIWRKAECKEYMEEVKREEGIAVEEDVANRTITIPIYTQNLDELNLDSDKLYLVYKIFSDAYDSNLDIKSFANGFVFAMGLVDCWEQEIIEMLEEKPFELEA